MSKKIRLSLAAAFLLASTLSARVISYAPYTDRGAIPALQHRLNRHFVLVEASGILPMGPIPIFAPVPAGVYGQVVIYDATGALEPRVVFPTDGTQEWMNVAAVRERSELDPRFGAPIERHVSTILLQTTSILGGQNPQGKLVFVLSNDDGATWKIVNLPASQTVYQLLLGSADAGGPYARGRYSPIRIGTEAYPFVVAIQESVYAVGADGSVAILYRAPALPVTGPVGAPTQVNFAQLVGSDKDGTRFLVRTANELVAVSLNDTATVATVSTSAPIEAWITPDGGIYVEKNEGSKLVISYIKGTQKTDLVSVEGIDTAFAVPTSDYAGAWILQRGPGKPTTLYLHRNGQLAKQWEDITAPEVEALHAGASGNKLLVQVHRPRPQADQRLFKDPALAVWTVGQPAPRVYDELFMNEQTTKGFVHLDVDRIEAGDPFVFDSGTMSQSIPVISPQPVPPPTSGGGDVVQEWGVVRASLKQRLVLPSVGRTGGAFGSFWVTDLILQNPLDTAQPITLRFVPTGDGPHTTVLNDTTITLGANEIRLVEDALRSLFGLESGIGALFIDPESGASVASRTYTRSAAGTYGFAMNAIDFYAAAASPRFPVSFAGALPGSNFRTNMILTDTSGRGTEASVTAAGVFGPMGRSDVTFTAIPNGQQQNNGLTGFLGLQSHDFGALIVRPKTGTAIASVFAVDNRTNDSTYFPPDLPSPVVRTIPVIGHIDGANGSRFRSDLYLYNPSGQTRSVFLQVTMWDGASNPAQITLTLLPNEAKFIPDVMTAFGKTGLARLRYQSSNDSTGIRVTSRTYTIDENGGTYGFLMPPLNNFQSGTSGDTLEILGSVADDRYRTNIGLVELTSFATGQNARVRIEVINSTGGTVDKFEVNVPVAGGMQLNDIFRSRSVNVSGPVLIRVSPLSGTIGSYATFTDNVTNDSSYLAANLGARE